MFWKLRVLGRTRIRCLNLILVSSRFLSLGTSLLFQTCQLLLSLGGLYLFWLVHVLLWWDFWRRVARVRVYHFFVNSGRLIPLATIILFSGLIPLRIVDLFDTFLLHVGPVDSLGVVVGNVSGLGGPGDGVFLFMD